MLRKIAISVLAAVALVAAVARSEKQCLSATEETLFNDVDDDLLPDSVEWVSLTNSTNPDTDGDGISDFVEVVQRGRPRQAGEPMPRDQEMRIMVTGPHPGGGDTQAWLHLMVRLIGPMSGMTSFTAWLEMPSAPGLRFSFDIMSFGPGVMRQRNAGAEGTWLTLSVPLVSTAFLHLLAPFSLHAESTIAGRTIHSAVHLFDLQGQLSTLVPFNSSSFAVQTIAATPFTGGALSNRVCLMDLNEVGSGPGGTIYEVVAAHCEDCNEVECSPTCPQSVGWLVTIPGGLGTLGGN